MKQKYIVLLTLVWFALTYANWESIGPYGGQLRAIAVAPTNEDIILAASNYNPGRLFRSTDNGTSWHDFGSIPYYINTINFDPNNTSIIYLGTYLSIYKSTNGGSTWTTYPVSDTYVNDLAIHANNPATLHVAAGITDSIMIFMGYFKSTNGGVTWTNVILDTLKGVSSCVAVDYNDSNIVYVAGNSSYNNQNLPRVYRSTDCGSSFSDISSDLPVDFSISSIAVHPIDPNILYVSSFYPGDIYRSTNAGTTWSLVQSAPYISCIVTTPVMPDVAYAGADTIIYKSTDSGESWFNCGSGYSYEVKQPRALVASMNTATDLYCVDLFGFYKTTNSGSTWIESNYGICLASVLTLECAPSSPSTIYTGLDMTGVIKTTNSGNTWTQLPEFLSCGNICSFASHNTDPDIILALEGSG